MEEGIVFFVSRLHTVEKKETREQPVHAVVFWGAEVGYWTRSLRSPVLEVDQDRRAILNSPVANESATNLFSCIFNAVENEIICWYRMSRKEEAQSSENEQEKKKDEAAEAICGKEKNDVAAEATVLAMLKEEKSRQKRIEKRKGHRKNI